MQFDSKASKVWSKSALPGGWVSVSVNCAWASLDHFKYEYHLEVVVAPTYKCEFPVLRILTP